MLKKYLFVSSQKAKRFTKLELSLIFLIYIIFETSLIELNRFINSFNIFFAVLFFLCLGIFIFSTLGNSKKSEQFFLKNNVKNFNLLKWNFWKQLSIHLIFYVPIAIFAPNFWLTLLYFVGFYSICFLSKHRSKLQINIQLKLPITIKKEVNLIFSNPYVYFFLLLYFLAFLLPNFNREIQYFLIFAVIYIYHDAISLNTIGIEQKELQFLKREKHLTIKAIWKKYCFNFFASLIFLVLLIVKKKIEFSTFFLFYFINFLISSILGISFPYQEGTAAKVQIRAVYIELLVMIFWTYWFTNFEHLILSIIMILAGIFILNRKIRSFIYEN